jgi:hypothetical protein
MKTEKERPLADVRGGGGGGAELYYGEKTWAFYKAINMYSLTYPLEEGPDRATVLAGRDGEVGVQVRHQVGGLGNLVDEDEG